MIAAKLGYSERKAAWKAVQSALREIVAEPAQHARRRQPSRDGAYPLKGAEQAEK